MLVVARMIAIGGATAREGRAYLRRQPATLALGVAGLTWLTAAAAFMLAEGVQPDGVLYPFEDALWWSTTTITTVGYGDIYPLTRAGRLVGAFTMVVGISAFAVVTAKVAELLVLSERADATDREEVAWGKGLAAPTSHRSCRRLAMAPMRRLSAPWICRRPSFAMRADGWPNSTRLPVAGLARGRTSSRGGSK